MVLSKGRKLVVAKVRHSISHAVNYWQFTCYSFLISFLPSLSLLPPSLPHPHSSFPSRPPWLRSSHILPSSLYTSPSVPLTFHPSSFPMNSHIPLTSSPLSPKLSTTVQTYNVKGSFSVADKNYNYSQVVHTKIVSFHIVQSSLRQINNFSKTITASLFIVA